MTKQVINTGSLPNDDTGDPLLIAFGKCNANFTELYAGAVPGTGTVTSVAVSSTDMVVSGSPITLAGNIGLALNTQPITPGSYTNVNLTVNSKGVITSVTSGSTAGTVTSVGITSADLTVTGSPVTGSGSIGLTLPTTVAPGAYTNTNLTVSAKGIITAIATGTVGVSQQGVVLSAQPGIDKTGVSDSWAGFTTAYALALSLGVPLIIDCKCWISVTTNDSRCIFLRTGTWLQGTPSGQLIIDNSYIPTFILHHATDWIISNLRIRYIGAPPWDITTGVYPALIPHFNDTIMKGDMAANFGNTFSGSGSSLFVGNSNPQSVFRVMGQCARGTFFNVTIDVPQGANAANFAAVGYSFDPQWTPGTLVPNNNQAVTASVAVIPTDIDMLYCRVDGVYMGIVGSGGIRIHGLKGWRYSDLQQAGGTGPGGNATYFAPPHLIYLSDPDPSFTNWEREVCNVFDYGQYVGGATRRSTASGTILSLKLAPCKNTIVDGYTSLRPDGFCDVLTNQYGNAFGNMKNCYYVYDSTTLTTGGGNVWGMRFPSANPYNYLTIDGLVGRDVNPSPIVFPVLDMTNVLNQNCDFKNVKMYLNDWAGTSNFPGFGMGGNNMTLDADYYFNQYSSDTTLRGSFCNQGTALMTNGDVNARVHGWRLFPVLFSAPPTLNTALSANWTHSTGVYLLQFSDNEVRYVTLTNGSTVTTWAAGAGTLNGQPTTGASGTGAIATITYSGGGTVAPVGTNITISGVTPAGYNGTFAVTASGPGSVSYANATTGAQTVAGTLANFVQATAQNVLAANYNGYKQRMLSMQAGKGIGNRIRIMDVSNGLEQVCQNGAVLESWAQTWNGTPTAGLTFDLPISVPATHNPDMATAFVQAALGNSGGLTSFAVGWAATPAALLNTIAIGTNTNAQTAYAGTILTNAGTNRVIRLTATGGTGFDGTGTVQITVRCQSVQGAT